MIAGHSRGPRSDFPACGPRVYAQPLEGVAFVATLYGFVSTYPPTQCGLATFTAALLRALTAQGPDDARVARVLDAPQPPDGFKVVTDIVAGDHAGAIRSAGRLNECDVVILQHEFGIYGGTDGKDVLALMAALKVPTIVVLHTVLTDPTWHQRHVLESVMTASSAIVTMSRTARDRLLAGYRVEPGKVSIIAHGAPDSTGRTTGQQPPSLGHQPTILTWGLLGPGKGIEWAVAALAQLRDVDPSPRYIVAGQTHPKVLQRDGEAYRDSLDQLVHRLGLSDSVVLDSRYRDAAALDELVASADVVLLPYDSTDQVTSGVLIEAVAAGKPVVATSFPHAVELLSGGAGTVVDHQDPTAIADALRQVLTQPEVATAMAAAATGAAPELRWSAVADRYRQLADRLISDVAIDAA